MGPKPESITRREGGGGEREGGGERGRGREGSRQGGAPPTNGGNVQKSMRAHEELAADLVSRKHKGHVLHTKYGHSEGWRVEKKKKKQQRGKKRKEE